MYINELKLKGAYEVIPEIRHDNRGNFIKIFNDELFRNHNINVNVKEQYFSTSHKGVIRGLHFQHPPFDHSKYVYCISGSVQDVILDLRKDSVTYGQYYSVILNSKKSNALFVPKGFAHGFCSLEDNSCMVYNVSTVYNPSADCGILWNSCNIDWNTTKPIISERDSDFISLADFTSPF